MTAPPCDPNWRDHPDQLDALCQQGAEQLYGRQPTPRDIETVTPAKEYL